MNARQWFSNILFLKLDTIQSLTIQLQENSLTLIDNNDLEYERWILKQFEYTFYETFLPLLLLLLPKNR